jgi:cytochrome c-type biogenesis protein CcmH
VQLDSKVFQIASQLRCPVCVAESVSASQSPTSQEMRQIIREQLQEGKSEQQIINFFKARYGDWILMDPPKQGLHLVVWVLPLLGFAAALALLIFYFRRWLKRAKAPVEASPEELDRVHQEMGQPEGP